MFEEKTLQIKLKILITKEQSSRYQTDFHEAFFKGHWYVKKCTANLKHAITLMGAYSPKQHQSDYFHIKFKGCNYFSKMLDLDFHTIYSSQIFTRIAKAF